jgi:hypothetical protein
MAYFGSTAERVQERTNEFSAWLWVLYFLNAVTISLPAIAYTDWLIYDIQMPLDKQNDYYAFVFVPNAFKPLYAIISEEFPLRGSHRRSWLCISSLGTAVMFLVQSLFVDSTLGAFASSFALQLFYSFSELLLGSCLMDVAHKDMRNAGAVQAMATTARFAGSISAALTNFALYPEGESSGSRINPRTVIALTALSPLLVAVVSSALPDKKTTGNEGDLNEIKSGITGEAPVTGDGDTLDTIPSPLFTNTGSDSHGHSHSINQEREREPRSVGLEFTQGAGMMIEEMNQGEKKENGGTDENRRRSLGQIVRFYAALFGAEVTLVWVSLKAVIADTPFYVVMSVLLALTAVLVAYLLHYISSDGSEDIAGGSRRNTEGTFVPDQDWCAALHRVWARVGLRGPENRDLITIGPALFLFLYAATPTAAIQYSSFQFQLFQERPYYLVHLSLVSEGTALLACVSYGLLANRRHVRVCIAITTVLSAAAGLMGLPLLGVSGIDDSVDVGPAGALTPYHYALLSTCVTGFMGQLAFIPLQVLATESTPSRQRLLAYAIYLSSLDAGNSVSDWITSPLVTLFGVSYDDYSGLFQLTLVASCTSVAVLVLLPVLVPPTPISLARED